MTITAAITIGSRVSTATSCTMRGVTVTPESRQTASALDLLLRRVDESGAGLGLSPEARDEARSHALRLFESYGRPSDACGLVALGYAAELLSLNAVDLAANPAQTTRLIAQIERLAEIPRIALGREVLRSGGLRDLPLSVAIEVQLALVLAFSGATSVSLWTLPRGGTPTVVSQAGDPDLEPAREAASVLLTQSRTPVGLDLPGVRIDRLHPPPAALVATPAPPQTWSGKVLLDAAAPDLAALLDRDTLITQEHETHDATASAVERRLARLRYDLHDGPQQDVHLLAQDLALFREQLRPMIAGDDNASRLLGRLDDLDAQLVALDGDLRRLSTSVQSPFLHTGSLPDALDELTATFAQRTGVRPRLQLRGTLAYLSDSQQITLLALIREALSNVRKHSDARSVEISIVSDQRGVRAEVTDDGRGFDPESTLVRSARAGRLGLVGMHERVRMLGGRTHIDSRPGGPTVISATLPPWPSPSS